MRYRGFGFSVEVPERMGDAIRKLVPRTTPAVEELVVQEPPEVVLASREPEMAFTRDFVTKGAPAFAKAAREKDEIAGHHWYHTIELPDGSVTPGFYDHRRLVPHYGFPSDLRGKRVLDVGSGDGFWAFELERRGAEVTSLDITTFAETDFPRALRQMYLEHPVDLPFRRGMEIAHRRLGSTVKLVDRPVYELDPDDMGTFDLVHAGDILLHLRDPALALQRIREVTSGQCLLADVFDPALDGLGGGSGLTRYRGGWSDTQWWTPALSTLAQMVADAGFEGVEVVTTYNLVPRGAVEGPWRAVLQGRVDGRNDLISEQ